MCVPLIVGIGPLSHVDAVPGVDLLCLSPFLSGLMESIHRWGLSFVLFEFLSSGVDFSRLSLLSALVSMSLVLSCLAWL